MGTATRNVTKFSNSAKVDCLREFDAYHCHSDHMMLLATYLKALDIASQLIRMLDKVHEFQHMGTKSSLSFNFWGIQFHLMGILQEKIKNKQK